MELYPHLVQSLLAGMYRYFGVTLEGAWSASTLGSSYIFQLISLIFLAINTNGSCDHSSVSLSVPLYSIKASLALSMQS